MTKVSLSSVAPEGKQQHKHANKCPLSPWPQQYGWLKVVGTVANGKFQSVNELLQGTSGQYREEKPENGFLII